MDAEKLIESVRSFECLWEVKNQGYKDRNRRENAWKEVSSAMAVEPEECASKWKTLRDKFVREMKKVKGGKSGDAGPPYKPTWHLFTLIEFLSDTVQHRQTHSNLCSTNSGARHTTPPPPESADVAGSVQETEDDTSFLDSRTCSLSPVEPASETSSRSSSVQPPPKKRRQGKDEDDDVFVKHLRRIEERTEQQRGTSTDEDEVFGQQVVAIMKRFEPSKKSTARIRVLQLLHDMEFSTTHTPFHYPSQ